jgi:hypothetical protein
VMSGNGHLMLVPGFEVFQDESQQVFTACFIFLILDAVIPPSTVLAA